VESRHDGSAAGRGSGHPQGVHTRRAWIGGLVGVLGFLLLAPLTVLLTAAPSNAVTTLCLPQIDKTGCITSTIGSRADPVAGVDVILTKPDGTTETQTTGDDGKFSFTVTESGTYFVDVDDKSLPEGFQACPPEDEAQQGPDGSVKVQAALGKLTAATIAIREGECETTSSKVDELIQSSASGLRLGLLLALASVGLSLIYGTTGLSNFAHAEQVTLGGMVGYGLINVWGINLWLGGLMVVLICGLTGWLQDIAMWQPLRRRGLGLTQLMIVTIGLSLAMQYAFQFFVGARTVRVLIENPTVNKIGPITLTNQSYVAMGIAIVVLSGVGYALLRTRIGRATRAVSDNPALAAASGIDVDKVIRLVWTVAMALAGLSGLLYALVTNGIKWDSGLQILLLLFAAVTLGGLGTAFGALIGSLVIGLVVELAPVIGIPGDFKYATALLILILLLLVRPQGLLGKAQRIG